MALLPREARGHRRGRARHGLRLRPDPARRHRRRALDARQEDLGADDPARGHEAATADTRRSRRPARRPARARAGGCGSYAQDTHIPECAVVAAAGRASRRPGRPDAAPGAEDVSPGRPIRLFDRPEPIETIAAVPDGPPVRFRWRRVMHEIAAIEGPERIAPEWWNGAAELTRDYFRAEDRDGRRFWLFREGLFGARPRSRAGSCTACSGDRAPRPRWIHACAGIRVGHRASPLRRIRRHHQFLLPARRLASRGTGGPGPCARARRASASPTATRSPAWCAPMFRQGAHSRRGRLPRRRRGAARLRRRHARHPRPIRRTAPPMAG